MHNKIMFLQPTPRAASVFALCCGGGHPQFVLPALIFPTSQFKPLHSYYLPRDFRPLSILLSHLLKSECTMFLFFLYERQFISFRFYKKLSYLSKIRFESQVRAKFFPSPMDSQNSNTLSFFGKVWEVCSLLLCCLCRCFCHLLVVVVVAAVVDSLLLLSLLLPLSSSLHLSSSRHCGCGHCRHPHL